MTGRAASLRLPLIAAPMLTVSGPDLVVAACAAGVVGAFPTANCRTTAELDEWLAAMTERLAPAAGAGPVCPNLIVHRSNRRLDDDLASVVRHGVEVVITSVGSPAPVVEGLRAAGCRVWCDVASLRHADRAAALGVDGLVLLTAGAGGQTGQANPFAFVRAVRERFDGTVVLAGGVADGRSLWAARVLGCDLAYMGTRFIATDESLAPLAYKRMVAESELDDVVLTTAFTGLETNMLAPSILAAGIDLAALEQPDGSALAALTDGSGTTKWRDIWSAGHSVSGVRDVMPVAQLVDRLAAEYAQARETPVRG
jgi:nitronate monooxygenase